MLLTEIKFVELSLTEEELREAMNLDFVELYKTYGSWMHPSKPEPVYVRNKQGHVEKAQEILGANEINQEQSEYSKMFAKGWVRCVHNSMTNFTLSGTAEALSSIIPKLAELRNATARIFIDVEDCSGTRCRSVNSGSFVMPAQWNDMRRAIA